MESHIRECDEQQKQDVSSQINACGIAILRNCMPLLEIICHKTMSNVCIVVFCGIPGAGKTSFATQLGLRREFRQNDVAMLPWPASDNINSSLGNSLSQDADDRVTMSIFHICYDKLMPTNVERALVEESKLEGDGDLKLVQYISYENEAVVI